MGCGWWEAGGEWSEGGGGCCEAKAWWVGWDQWLMDRAENELTMVDLEAHQDR